MFFHFLMDSLCRRPVKQWGLLLLVATLLVSFTRPVMAQEPAGSTARLDLTGNNIIDDADAWRVAEAWTDLQARGQCIAPEWSERDVNGDGCINLVDVQLVLAHWGERLAPQAGQGTGDVGVLATKTFTVNSSGNGSDDDLTDGDCETSEGNCTLRAAIQQANARDGQEEIRFNIRNSNGSCPEVVTIKPGSGHLIIDDPEDDGIIIDGYSQCGARENSMQVGGNAVIKIQIEGSGGGDGLTIYSAKNVVRGLALYNWTRKIFLDGSGAKENQVKGNFIGSNAANNCQMVTGEGITLESSVTNNVIGGTSPADRNVIICNSEDGIELFGSRVANNRIIGNYIGVKQDGRTPGGNRADGIDIAEGAFDNWIGGPNSNERNVISGNRRDGIEISHQTGTKNNRVVGNYIGLAANGQDPVGNGSNGITLEDLVNNNQIYNNVIVDNGANGLRFYALCNDNLVRDNLVGVGLDRSTPMPNGQNPSLNLGLHGIYMLGGSQRNLIYRNIIANQPEQGIYLTREEGYLGYSRDTNFNTFSENSIYNNGLRGIRLKDRNGQYPNQGIDYPTIQAANKDVVIGQTCADCVVEIFMADNDSSGRGEGKTFIGRGTANGSGEFLINVNGSGVGKQITATATDGQGNTSEFGDNFITVEGPPPSFILPRAWIPLVLKN